jgi:glycosyltransferase involved in cell wall biosynthesis
MARLLRGAGALVLPSRYHEFAPYSALEAMAAGVPVVATRMGGVPELVGPERCLPPGDAPALATRLRELFDDPHRRRSEGEALLRRAREGHGQERFTRALLNLYERVSAGA